MSARAWMGAILVVGLGAVASERAALAYDDNVGGDDKVIFTDPDIATRNSYCVDIAENGDMYVAVERVDPAEGSEIQVLRSQDGGDTWGLWGTRSDPDPTRNYRQPSLHIAEGNESRLYLAYQYENGAANRTINVAYSNMDLPSASWTVQTAMSLVGVDFQYPSLSSDGMNFAAYRLYLAAEGDDGNGADIWFGRSTTFGSSWEPAYTIATLSAGDRNYLRPEIRYGRGGVVHCVWYFAIDGNTDTAIRYRRALNYASAGADWQPVVQITTTTGGRRDSHPSVAASHWGDNVLIGYLDVPASVSESQLRLSTDAGATWSSANSVDLTIGAFGPELLALPGGQGFQVCGYLWDVGGNYDSIGYYSLTESAPLTLSPERIVQEQLQGSGLGDPTVALAYDASRGNRIACVWGIDPFVGSRELFMDAEWRADPGYPNLEENFPLFLAAGAVASPALADMDGDVDLEIVFGDADGFIQVYNPDATAVSGWPVDIGDFPPTYPAPGGYPTTNSTVAVDDLDGDGSPEIVAGNADGQVCVYRSDGTPMPGWPLNLGAGLDVFVSIGSIAFGSHRQIVACAGTQVHLLRPDATESPGFPVTVAYDLTAPAAIGNLDADEKVDLVVTGGRQLNWFDRDGTWRFRLTFPEGMSFSGQASLADVDLNGDLEIACVSSNGIIHLMHHTGDYMWSYQDPSATYLTSAAFANVIGTFEPDVAFASRSWKAHLFLSSGAEAQGWPHETGPGYYLLGSPIMDTTDEGSPDVIIGSRDGNAYAWNNLFTNVPGWPKELHGQCNTSPASGDIDDDGRLEVVFATSDRLYVLDTGGQVMHADPKKQWPMYGCDPGRTACLACPKDAASGVTEETSARSGPLRLASSNPAGSSTRLQFQLAASAAVRLAVFDVSGRIVRELLRDEFPAGRHDIAWDGRDAQGGPVASGTYFCRLQVGPAESVVRVQIIK